MKLSETVFFFFFVFLFIANVGLSIPLGNHKTAFSVTNYGAVGDGKTDDSQAFLKTWKAVCGAVSGNPILNVPKQTFLLKPVTFKGPCKSSVSIQMEGTLLAPEQTWDTSEEDGDSWIRFSDISDIKINGAGEIDGQGSIWWKRCDSSKKLTSYTDRHGSGDCADRPTAMHFHKCEGLELSGLNFKNIQKNHISLNQCTNVDIGNLDIEAPEDSPNTDGIDISESTSVNIHNSGIATGDDCIAINTGSSFINITNLVCGPGHGISIGSLGKKGESAAVEEIKVFNCTFVETDNGARIKTFEGGSGYARKITFQKIQFIDSKNPIIIDQHYGNKIQKNGKDVEISDVTFRDMNGTSASEKAISIECSENSGCKNIVMERVNLVAGEKVEAVSAVCANAHGSQSSTTPHVDCLMAI